MRWEIWIYLIIFTSQLFNDRIDILKGFCSPFRKSFFTFSSYKIKMVYTPVEKAFVISNYIENNHSINTVQRKFRVRFQTREFPNKMITFNTNIFFFSRLFNYWSLLIVNNEMVDAFYGNREQWRWPQKQAGTRPKVNEENLQRVMTVYDENPKISIRKAGQHLSLSDYATRVLIRKGIFKDILKIFTKWCLNFIK